MFKGYKELSDRERLILAQLPEGRLEGSPASRVPEWKGQSDIRKNSGLETRTFRATVRLLLEKGLIERARVQFLERRKNETLVSIVLALRRAGKAVKKTRAIARL